MTVSIIIPVLNEEKEIEKSLKHLRKFRTQSEIILVDGGSKDKTIEIASRFDYVTIVSSRRERAQQMNAGAKVAEGDVLLFLHADTYLPIDAIEAVKKAVEDGTDYGCFSVKIDSPRLPRVRFWTYVFWSWLCMLPGTVLYVVGTDAVVSGISQGRIPWILIFIVIVIAGILVILTRYARRKLKEDETDTD